MKLNLGCGPDYREGWVNVDMDRTVHADAHASVTDYVELARIIGTAHQFTGEPVRLIYMKHVLEHLPIAAIEPHLAWCYRTLAPGGELVVDGPDLRAMCLRLAMKPQWTWDDVRMIFGGQDDEFDFHKTGWGHEFLAALFQQAGFVNIEVQRVDLCSVVVGRKAA